MAKRSRSKRRTRARKSTLKNSSRAIQPSDRKPRREWDLQPSRRRRGFRLTDEALSEIVRNIASEKTKRKQPTKRPPSSSAAAAKRSSDRLDSYRAVRAQRGAKNTATVNRPSQFKAAKSGRTSSSLGSRVGDHTETKRKAGGLGAATHPEGIHDLDRARCKSRPPNNRSKGGGSRAFIPWCK